jgi:hypothetical protein
VGTGTMPRPQEQRRSLVIPAITAVKADTRKGLLKKHPEKLPPKSFKSCVVFSDDLVIKIIDLKAPAKTEHMFWSKRHVPSGNFSIKCRCKHVGSGECFG